VEEEAALEGTDVGVEGDGVAAVGEGDSARRRVFNGLTFVNCVHQTAGLGWFCYRFFFVGVYKYEKVCMNSQDGVQTSGTGWVDHCRAF